MSTWIVRFFTQEARVTAASLSWVEGHAVFKDAHGRICFTAKNADFVEIFDEQADRKVEYRKVGGEDFA